MVDIQSKEAIDKISQELKVQPSMAIGRKLSENVQMVFEVGDNKTFQQIVEGSGDVNTASIVVFTTPTDRDFYLTGATLSMIKDVNATSTLTQLRVVIRGAIKSILRISGISLTVQDGAISFQPCVPIKLDRNTTIDIVNTTAIAAIRADASITGFLIDPQ